jgi:signal transduction histidine kinase
MIIDAVTENALRHEQVQTLGRLMAGFSHDMKNHLGIIRESNGLLSDFVEFSEMHGDERTMERMQKAIASVERRIVVVADVLHHLSGLAHRADVEYTTLSINELLLEEYAFLIRFARLKQISFEVHPGEDIRAVHNNPSLLQHIFYRLFELCLDQLSKDCSLIIKTTMEENSVQVTYQLSHAIVVEETDVLQAALTKVGGVLLAEPTADACTGLHLRVPSLSSDFFEQ